jgi:hypothetical protein
MHHSHPTAQSAEELLAWINRQLEVISAKQHRLAHRKMTLQEQATRLRLGASPAMVRLALREASTAASLAVFPVPRSERSKGSGRAT